MSEHKIYALSPTVEIIDAWIAQTEHDPDDPRACRSWCDDHYGVDIRTKSGSWRCVTSRVEHGGHVFYWTIRGEGSSNAGRETAVRADRIVAARGHMLPGYDPVLRAEAKAARQSE